MKNKESVIRFILMMIAFSSVSALALITFFIFMEGLPIIFKTGVLNFIGGLNGPRRVAVSEYFQ